MTPRLIFRWIVFLLAAFYCVRFSEYDGFAGPFRFLTVWALFASFYCASRMIAREEGRTERRWDGLVSATAVLNGMVVYLFWSLYFNDPESVTRDGSLQNWWLEYYLHLIGPALQWIDALFIHRSFRTLQSGAAWLAGIVLAWIAWIELVIQPLSSTPTGDVTSGLPYRFLNNMELADRVPFYAANLAAGLGLLLVLASFAWLVRWRFGTGSAP